MRLNLLTKDENDWLTMCRFVGVPAEPGLRLYKLWCAIPPEPTEKS